MIRERNESLADPRTQKIARLNDEARIAPGLTCELCVTAGIQSLPEDDRREIYNRVCGYNDFTWYNDARGQHGSGYFTYAGLQIFWHIAYRAAESAPGADSWSEHPEDPEKTRRVLTIMLAREHPSMTDEDAPIAARVVPSSPSAAK